MTLKKQQRQERVLRFLDVRVGDMLEGLERDNCGILDAAQLDLIHKYLRNCVDDLGRDLFPEDNNEGEGLGTEIQ